MARYKGIGALFLWNYSLPSDICNTCEKSEEASRYNQEGPPLNLTECLLTFREIEGRLVIILRTARENYKGKYNRCVNYLES